MLLEALLRVWASDEPLQSLGFSQLEQSVHLLASFDSLLHDPFVNWLVPLRLPPAGKRTRHVLILVHSILETRACSDELHFLIIYLVLKEWFCLELPLHLESRSNAILLGRGGDFVSQLKNGASHFNLLLILMLRRLWSLAPLDDGDLLLKLLLLHILERTQVELVHVVVRQVFVRLRG